MYLLTRGLFKVGFEWLRLAQLARSSPAWPSPASCCCRRTGSRGLALRVAWLALVPALLALTRFFHPHERVQARALVSRRAAAGGRLPRRER